MDSLKEIFDAVNSRIRSPIFGSIVVVFIILNWRELYFLAFANATATQRIQYFDEHTTIWSKIVFPVFCGFAFAMASPWIALFSTWAAESPTTRRKIRQTKSADTILTEKLHLEQTRIRRQAQLETARIAEAKRDEEIKEISDPEIRKELEKDVNDIRKSSISDSSDLEENNTNRVVRIRTRIELLQKERDSFKGRGKLENVAALDEQIQKAIDELGK